MSERCRCLFQNIAAAKWVIPVGSELMKELEACEYEVAAVLAVMVGAVLIRPSSLFLTLCSSNKSSSLCEH